MIVLLKLQDKLDTVSRQATGQPSDDLGCHTRPADVGFSETLALSHPCFRLCSFCKTATTMARRPRGAACCTSSRSSTPETWCVFDMTRVPLLLLLEQKLLSGDWVSACFSSKRASFWAFCRRVCIDWVIRLEICHGQCDRQRGTHNCIQNQSTTPHAECSTLLLHSRPIHNRSFM